MEEKKVYDMGDVETFFDELGDLIGYDELEDKLSDKGLHEYSLTYLEVMAGGLTEEEVGTPEFCKTFCEGMLEIKKELSK